MPTSFVFAPEFAPAIAALFGRAHSRPEWNLRLEEFRAALERSAASRFRDAQPPSRELAAYLETLHVEDLAVACACSKGNALAWEFFMAQYRPELYRAARAIAGDANGSELADSLYAELYGLTSRGEPRRSLFDYFHGRSKLGTWLRAILAQRHVDEIRRGRRTESIDDPDKDSPLEVPQRATPAEAGREEPDRSRFLALLQAVLAEALGALEPRDRLRLAYYYVDDLTLAQIGRLLDEHEATVSRKLDRVRKELRQRVDAVLREKKRLSDAQVQLCYEYAREEWPFDLTRALSTRE